jgi:hypothetical protein
VDHGERQLTKVNHISVVEESINGRVWSAQPDKLLNLDSRYASGHQRSKEPIKLVLMRRNVGSVKLMHRDDGPDVVPQCRIPTNVIAVAVRIDDLQWTVAASVLLQNVRHKSRFHVRSAHRIHDE